MGVGNSFFWQLASIQVTSASHPNNLRSRFAQSVGWPFSYEKFLCTKSMNLAAFINQIDTVTMPWWIHQQSFFLVWRVQRPIVLTHRGRDMRSYCCDRKSEACDFQTSFQFKQTNVKHLFSIHYVSSLYSAFAQRQHPLARLICERPGVWITADLEIPNTTPGQFWWS